MQRLATKRLSVLLLADNGKYHANTVLDHIAAFSKYSQHQIYLYNPRWLMQNKLLDLEEFDVVVLHYSLAIIYSHYLPDDLREKLRSYSGLKVQYIQDDYRQVDQYTAAMRDIGIDILFTPYPEHKIPSLYTEERLPGVKKYTTLTGYVPDRYLTVPHRPLSERPIDVGYRGRDLPYWLGSLAQEKTWIAQGFLERAVRYNLVCDIAWKEEDRIYGAAWDEFISSCKAMLGTESGASITDFDGSVERRTKEYLSAHPDADFWEVYEKVLAPYDGNLVENTISPRIFECAAHRTALVLFPGEYAGVIRPWEHYIPLKKDFSNFAEVVERIRDLDYLEQMTLHTYDDLIASGRYSYRKMVETFDRAIAEVGIDARRRGKFHYRAALIEREIVLPLSKLNARFNPGNKRLLLGLPLALVRALKDRVRQSFYHLVALLRKVLPLSLYRRLRAIYRKVRRIPPPAFVRFL